MPPDAHRVPMHCIGRFNHSRAHEFNREDNMIHHIHDPVESAPLDSFSSPVERRLSLRAGEVIATAAVRAGWGRLEINIVEPAHLVGITVARDRTGFPAALMAQHYPARRFTYRGALTARAIDLVQQFLAKVIADHDMVARHAEPIARRCFRAQRHVQSLTAQQGKVTDPAARSALKRGLKRGELSQKEYQSILRRLRDHEMHSRCAIDSSRCEALADVAQDISDSPLPFDHALVHLSDPQILAALEPSTREQMELLLRNAG